MATVQRKKKSGSLRGPNCWMAIMRLLRLDCATGGGQKTRAVIRVRKGVGGRRRGEGYFKVSLGRGKRVERGSRADPATKCDENVRREEKKGCI